MGRRKSSSHPVSCIHVIVGGNKFHIKLDRKEKIRDRRKFESLLIGMRSALFEEEDSEPSSVISSPEEPIREEENKKISQIFGLSDPMSKPSLDIDFKFYCSALDEDFDSIFGL